jgi:predicted RNA polymerase sigma factor
VAPSVRGTAWGRIVAFYDLLMAQSPGPIVALNRALAVAERDGVEEGQRQLVSVADEKKLARYPFYWAALADLQRRAGKHGEARSSYERAMELSRSPAERASYRRRLHLLGTS